MDEKFSKKLFWHCRQKILPLMVIFVENLPLNIDLSNQPQSKQRKKHLERKGG
jgi:hypothetical protein